MVVRFPHDPVAMRTQVEIGTRAQPPGSATVGHTGVGAMMGRLSILAVGLVTGVAVAWVLPGLPGLPQLLPSVAALSVGEAPQEEKPAAESDAHAGFKDDRPSVVKLGVETIEAADIELAPVQSGAIARRIVVPGTIVPHADRIAHVAVKLSSIVAELRKNIGDPVANNEVLAVLESREIAEAKSEYLAARLTNELQQELFERDKALWEKRVSSEQQFLRSRNEAARAKMRTDITRQKLFALGVTETEIAGLPDQSEATLRRQEVRSPISGHVVERKVELGVAVGRDQLETELFVIADLARVWVELAVSPDDVPLVSMGATVSVAARAGTERTEGKVVFISPMLDRDTRLARVVAEIDNTDSVWRPGSFVTAAIEFEQRPVPLAVPVSAIQTMEAGPIVFVRTPEGFAARQVRFGQTDDRTAEVVSGLREGETIAVSNTFLLKAEMLKGSAED
jgi:membrane fusion protein, heavy metal efflux system